MTISELKNICESIEKQYGSKTKVGILLLSKDGRWDFNYITDHIVSCDGTLVLSNRNPFRVT